MVQLHYLAGDSGLERAIVVFGRGLSAIDVCTGEERNLHGRSGRVALPRVNGMLAGLAIFEMVERFRRVERAVDERRSVLDISDPWEVLWWRFSIRLMDYLVDVEKEE